LRIANSYQRKAFVVAFSIVVENGVSEIVREQFKTIGMLNES